MRKAKSKLINCGALHSGKSYFIFQKYAKIHFKHELGIKWYFLSKKKKQKLFNGFFEQCSYM